MFKNPQVKSIEEKIGHIFDIDPETGDLSLKDHPQIPNFKLVFVEGGKKTIGEEVKAEIEISSFYMGEFQVTQELYEAVTGENPSYFKGKRRPVENVTWYESVEFCKKLNSIFGLEQPVTGTGDDQRLDLNIAGFAYQPRQNGNMPREAV